MPPSSPSDLFWNALSPLLQQLEALGRLLEVCVTYYSWCAGCAAVLAFLLIVGLVLVERQDEASGVPTPFAEDDENLKTAECDDAPARSSPVNGQPHSTTP